MFEQTESKPYNKPKTRDIIIIISPIIVILLCHLIARIFFSFLGEWAWIPTVLLYWFIISLLTLMITRRDNFKSWFNKSKRNIWILILIIGGFSPFPLILLRNLNVLTIMNILLICLGIFYSIINGITEEIYWRGLIYSTKINLTRWILIIYNSTLFAVIHPLMLGVFSELNRTLYTLIIAFCIGIIYSIGYFKLESLRWLIFSHIIADIGSLNVFVFMNLL